MTQNEIPREHYIEVYKSGWQDESDYLQNRGFPDITSIKITNNEKY